MVKLKQESEEEGRSGIGVDAMGDAVVDPTKNVLDLVRAESKYQDGMRDANNALVQAQLKCQEEVTILRADHAKELTRAESRRIDEQAQLRADFTDKLSSAEAKRIDAIRAVDVNAVSVDRAKASDQATVLAAQVAQTAEALRNLVATTANTIAQSNQAANAALSTRITTLEQAQYKGEGQSGVRDPQMVDLLAEVKAMRGTRSEGIDKTWGIVAVVVTLIISGVVAFVAMNRAPSSVVPPQVIYVPAPVAAPPTISPK